MNTGNKKGIPEKAPEHIRFAVLAADVACFTVRDDGKLCVRLITVNRPPHFPGMPGLPGGLLDPKETAEEAATRHLATKGNIRATGVYMEQLYTMSRVDRDPRGRVVSVAYLALVPWERLSAQEQAGDKETRWEEIGKATRLAYDHDEILSIAVRRLRARARYTTILSRIMPLEFSLTDLEETFERVLGVSIDKRNFRRKILALGVLAKSGNVRSGGQHRPAQLWKFKTKSVEEIEVL